MFMSRLDYSVYCRNLELKDTGYASFVSLIHMENSLMHPVKISFCELLLRAEKDDICSEKRKRTIRNKWRVVFTIINNPSLRKYRKCYLKKYQCKIETFRCFIKRNFPIHLHNKKFEYFFSYLYF